MSSRREASSVFSNRFRYWRERIGNAIWMLRTGRFKLFLQSIHMELYPTVEMVRSQLHLDVRPVSDSAYVDKRRVVRPGFRPTVAQPFSEPLNLANSQIVASELQQILSTLAIKEDSIP
jgi:hypothetical protein